MKKLFIGLVVLSWLYGIIAFAADIFCPQSISCKNQICNGFEAPLYFQWSSTSSFSDGIYSFYQAAGGAGATSEPCFYQQKSGEEATKIILGSQIELYPDKEVPENKWFQSGGGGFWCATTDPSGCPFYTENGK